MKTVREKGQPNRPGLQAREIRILDDAASVFRDMAHRCGEPERASAMHTAANRIDEAIKEYGPQPDDEPLPIEKAAKKSA